MCLFHCCCCASVRVALSACDASASVSALLQRVHVLLPDTLVNLSFLQAASALMAGSLACLIRTASQRHRRAGHARW
jgi:hypothetical protein